MRPNVWTLLTGILTFTTLISASNEYSDNDFTNNLDYVLEDLAPLWFFPTGTCYPESASPNGVQSLGSPGSGCSALNKGCPSPGPYNGQATLGTSFPTYWTTSDCSDGTKRICYDVYFTHDSGHKFDWEWACVVLEQNSEGMWVRGGIILEQDNKVAGQTSTPFYSWGELETWDDGQAMNDTTQRNGNHPMIYSAKFHHTMFPHQYTCLGKGNCATLVQQMYRNNDYVWPAGNNLVAGSSIPQEWNWGRAMSSPLHLKDEVCGFKLTGPGYANPPSCKEGTGGNWGR